MAQVNNKLSKYQKWKYVVTGIVVGTLIVIPIIGFANTPIAAWVSNNITIYFNGVAKKLPEGYDIITYNGRTYTPAKFIAEELGAKVEWDEDTKSINIIYEEETRVSYNEEWDNGAPIKKYKKLPLKDISPDVYVLITKIVLEDNVTWVYLGLEGRSDNPTQLRQSATKIKTENMTYLQTDLEYEKIIDPIDVRWYNDIRKEVLTSGYIKMPPLPKDTDKLTLYLEVFRNDGSNEVTEFEFDIAL